MPKKVEVGEYTPRPEAPAWQCSCARPVPLRWYFGRALCLCGKTIVL